MRRVDRWVFAAEDARRLAAVRIGLCCVLAYRLATTDYGLVAGQPPALFQPLAYMKLFDRMPSQGVATTLQICGIAAALIAAAGLVLRVTLPVAVACSLVLNGMLNSTGRVVVGDAVLNLCLLLLLAAAPAAGQAWSIRSRRRDTSGPRSGWPIRTMMITIALAYFFAGLQKWRYSGLPWVTSDNLRWVLYSSSDSHKYPNDLALFIADRPLLAHLFAAGSLLLETLFPFVLVPKLRWLFIPGAIAMHVGIRLATGLDYSTQWLAFLIVFVNWPVVVEWF